MGIKDTSDQLVAETLRALADIVPILGAATVIGGKRAKLFNDGRPISHNSRRLRRNSKKAQEPTITSHVSTDLIEELPERPSPDGEEGESSTEEIEQTIEDDLDNWEDWDINEENHNNLEGTTNPSDVVEVEAAVRVQESNSSNIDYKTHRNKVLPDISQLDIKNLVNSSENDDFDFFQDMEPVIQASTMFETSSTDDQSHSRLNLNVAEIGKVEEGWGDELEW